MEKVRSQEIKRQNVSSAPARTKIAACWIVKPDLEEAMLRDRCMASVLGNVDAMSVTVTGQSDDVDLVLQKYQARASRFEWVDDFSAARNYNLSQIPKEFTHVIWLDADDTVRGAKGIKDVVESMRAGGYDGVELKYEYDYDENGNCITEQTKTRIFKNDDTFTWVGAIHEELTATREILASTSEDIVIEHHPKADHYIESGARNLAIATSVLEKEG